MRYPWTQTLNLSSRESSLGSVMQLQCSLPVLWQLRILHVIVWAINVQYVWKKIKVHQCMMPQRKSVPHFKIVNSKVMTAGNKTFSQTAREFSINLIYNIMYWSKGIRNIPDSLAFIQTNTQANIQLACSYMLATISEGLRVHCI